MPDRDRPTGQVPRLVRDGETAETEPMKPGDLNDLNLLPRRFDFFATEVRDFMARMTREGGRLARLEAELDGVQEWSQKRYSLLADRLESIDRKLEQILNALERK